MTTVEVVAVHTAAPERPASKCAPEPQQPSEGPPSLREQGSVDGATWYGYKASVPEVIACVVWWNSTTELERCLALSADPATLQAAIEKSVVSAIRAGGKHAASLEYAYGFLDGVILAWLDAMREINRTIQAARKKFAESERATGDMRFATGYIYNSERPVGK